MIMDSFSLLFNILEYKSIMRIFFLSITIFFLGGCMLTRDKSVENTDSAKIWSDLPAFTQVLEYQNERGLTSDKYDGIWEGEEVPSLPRVPNPTVPVKHWHEGEGTNYLNEETVYLTRGKYSNPIRIWESEPYPIGNGRLAASVFHGSGRDRYTLNEVSFWSGGLNAGTINAQGDKSFDGEHGPEIGDDGFGGAQPVVDLIVDFDAPAEKGKFVREIDLEQGIVASAAKRKGVKIESLAFCSYPDQVMVTHYKADQVGGLNANFVLVTQRESDYVSIEGNTLIFQSRIANGMCCEARIEVRHEGGTLRQEGGKLILQGANACTLITVIETNYVMDYTKGFRGEEPQQRIAQRLEALDGKSMSDLLRRHQDDYRALYQRLSLDLGESSKDLQKLPTYRRLEIYGENDQTSDVGLEETLFNFGRYLTICTSRPGSLPAGLQGIWNSMIRAPWGNDYHSNINFQMVYWLTETGNLSECHVAMLDYLDAMREPFRVNTREYLKAIGEEPQTPHGEWIVYTSHNPFGAGGWQVNLPGAAWYGLHFWEHFAFTNDLTYLREQAYPIMKELCAYWMKHLKSLGKGGAGFQSNYQAVDVSKYPELSEIPEGTLVVPNGWSPEHGPRGEDGVAHDQQIVSELFLNTIKAAQILQVDHEWVKELQSLQQRLLPPQIGKRGNLMEWMIDRNPDTDHRHTSHLFAVYPGSIITMEKTPELAQAARCSLEYRKTTGDSRRSWAWAWRSMLWARLQDGDKAHEMIRGLLTYNMLDNLWATHQLPLQIDGNYGIAAAMLEMLVQSHSDVIELLPAPTKAWKQGSVKGVKARGNIEVALTWKDGVVTDWSLTSNRSQTVRVKVNGQYQTVHIQAQP